MFDITINNIRLPAKNKEIQSHFWGWVRQYKFGSARADEPGQSKEPRPNPKARPASQ